MKNNLLPWPYLRGFIQGVHEGGLTDREIAAAIGAVLGDEDLQPNRETIARWRRGECVASTLNKKAIQAWRAQIRSEK